MNALCPEHGYMVRRRDNAGLYFQVPGYSDANEENEDDGRNLYSEKEIMVEKQESSENDSDE